MVAEPESTEVWEARPGAARAPLARYRLREPEHTILHAVVRERLESFLAAARERSANGRGLRSFVERDLRGYLDCGILARGFVRVRCPDCSFERLVAFSCKAHICPSCAARQREPELPPERKVLLDPGHHGRCGGRRPEHHLSRACMPHPLG